MSPPTDASTPSLADRLPADLAEAHRRAASERGGEVATYIPELAKVDRELFGVAACTVDGEVTGVGDDRVEFTIQSLSKPFVYGWALARFGVEAVHERVGAEPTGDAFDSIIQLDANNRAHNPMVNAGAIAVTALFAGRDESARLAALVAELGRFAGRQLPGIDVPVYLSERTAGHRNRAIAHLLQHLGTLAAPVDQALDLYFQQCSALVTCRDLAVMAATLAAGGRNPLTGEQVLPAALVEHVLSVMFTSGLYDFSGGFAVDVGLPAKSGVSGGILAVAPGRLGIGAFAPPLDERGNSVRGMAAIGHLSETLRLHLFDSRAQPRKTSKPAPAAELEEVLATVHAELRDTAGGQVAAYIPQLANTSPELFGLAVCTVDGEEAAAGDADLTFTIQAAASPFTYALVAAERGLAKVHEHVDVEPSSNPFNAIHFNPRTNHPYNPLDNAGAITVCSLMPGADATTRLNRLLAGFAALAGEERMRLDAAVFLAEKTTGERNRAIASLLRNFDLVADEDAALELYFQQCSLRVTCRQLARLGATLAAGGVQPLTGEQVLPPEVVRNVLTVMATCGLHDESGRFAFEVGLPAKSGISGGILAVAPGRLALAAYSPPVNRHGTSVRGLLAIKALSRRLGLSVFAPESLPTPTPSV